MNPKTATDKARAILDEERSAPTVAYEPTPLSETSSTIEAIAAMGERLNLPSSRSKNPRPINENPLRYNLKSVNYDLLRALLSQCSASERPEYLRFVKNRIFGGTCARKGGTASTYPRWYDLVSELPLAVEFLARSGGKEDLFSALETPKGIASPGHVLMLMQIEEMIALNYTIFTDSEYERLRSTIGGFRDFVANYVRGRVSKNGDVTIYPRVQYPDCGSISLRTLEEAILSRSYSISEQCRKARYLYLKGSLLEGLNLEVNQDKVKLEDFLKRFHFTPLLSSSLDAADRLYREGATVFDFKSCLGHLRSFLENLQLEAMPKLHSKYGGNLPSTWGSGLAYLSKHEILSKTEEQFAATFYTLISDEGVHPLIAEREYARLARNMVIEYALLFLSKLDKLAIIP